MGLAELKGGSYPRVSSNVVKSKPLSSFHPRALAGELEARIFWLSLSSPGMSDAKLNNLLNDSEAIISGSIVVIEDVDCAMPGMPGALLDDTNDPVSGPIRSYVTPNRPTIGCAGRLGVLCQTTTLTATMTVSLHQPT